MRLIKKYSNRRLYDTQVSGYINLAELASLIQHGQQVQVHDAKTGEDLTRVVLMQVLMETKDGLELMPAGLLHRMIRMGAAPTERSEPMLRACVAQLAAGLETLDAQLGQVESQIPCTGPETTPDDSRFTAPQVEEPADAIGELRARLAAVEARLKRP